MIWKKAHLEHYPIPESCKAYLAQRGIDASKVLPPFEFCEAFDLSNRCCIGRIFSQALVISTGGEMLLIDDQNEEVIASSIASFVSLNDRLGEVDFDSAVNWEELLRELSEIDCNFLRSAFWREYVEYLYGL